MITELQRFDPAKKEWVTVKVITMVGDSDRFPIHAITASKKIAIKTPTKFRLKTKDNPTYHEWLLYPEDIQ